jgi:hypothetical protein
MSLRFLAPLGAFLLLTAPVWADHDPDFDEDAMPILEQQPHLVDYVHTHYDVKNPGEAKIPGDAQHPPGPPFIFQARPRHSSGPFYLRLLIQPGAPGHILKVVDMRNVHLPAPGDVPANEPASQGPPGAPPAQPQEQPAATAPAPTSPAATTPPPATGSSTQGVTSATPSGPIRDSGSGASTGSSNTDLAPPPDPAPTTQ